jgi:hypothetical protein
MRIRRFVLVVFLAAFAAPLALLPQVRPATADSVPYAVASETYYHVDTANGRMTVSVHAEFQNVQSKDLPDLPIYVMPGAENVVVKSGDDKLTVKLTPGDEANAKAGLADVTLLKPLKNNLRTTLDATYEIPPRTGGKFMDLESGLVETVLIGQGPGSFVLVDVPQEGDNYFDPGCLVASDQPKDVKAAGMQRWVCGEVTIIAINGDDPDVLKQCAAMADKCRQRLDPRVFSAYVQSVTDPSKLGKLEGDVTMPSGHTVHMVLKYFKKEQTWADKEWAVAQKAFPLLEGVFGYPYAPDSVTMRQSHHIENIGAAGIAFPTLGEVLLASNNGFDDEVTVHELAHQWAGFNLKTNWLWEGLAEYAQHRLASQIGYTPIDRKWQSFPFTDPLATWNNGSLVPFADYWYGKSGAFWAAYETAIGGPDKMTEVLSRMDDEKSLLPLDGGWFMDQGEWVSRTNLDELFTKWVYNPDTSKNLLANRRAAHNAVDELQARATTFGLSGMPSDIYDNLIAWVFDPVAGQVAKANKVLDSYQEVIKMSTDAGLGAPDGLSKVWGKKRITDSAATVEDQRQAITAILSATKALEGKADDSPSKQKLAEARQKYSEGDYAGARVAAAAGVTSDYNQTAAGKMIEIAKDKQKSFSPGFFGRFGLWMQNPSGDLKKAEAAYAAGDGTTALKLSRQAYNAWDGAEQRGIKVLAIIAGLMCAMCFGVWFVLRRLEGPIAVKKPGQGHFIEQSEERRSSWRDWENTQ